MNTRLAKLRSKLAGGELSCGMWMAIPSPTVAEIVADAGFDWVLVDAEHHPFNPETLLHMLLAFRGSDTVPIIRLANNDAVMIKQALDMGFEGVLLPNTNTAADTQRAVEACRYPPMGKRGFGPTRPSGYFRDGGAYGRTANDSIICAIQIEDVRGADEIEQIVKVPGLDWIFIGPYDMSGTMGIFGQVEHEELWEVMRKILRGAKAAKIPAGIPAQNPDDIERMREAGNQLFTIGQDVAIVRAATDHVVKVFGEKMKAWE